MSWRWSWAWNVGTSGGGGEDDPAQALLDEAAVRFDFSEYDDINAMFDVNNNWGPAKVLQPNAGVTYEFVADGLQATTDGVEVSSGRLTTGLQSPVVGPLTYGPDGLTTINVVRLVNALTDADALLIATELLQANSIGIEGTGYPQSEMGWTVTSDVAAAFYDSEPTEDTIADLFEDFSPFEAASAGVYVAVVVLDLTAQEVRVRLVGPDTDQSFTTAFVKPVPDYVADPWSIDDQVSELHMTLAEPAVASLIQVEWDGWNRALTAGEVDALVEHFTG